MTPVAEAVRSATRLTALVLRNVRPYEALESEFPEGTVVLVGPNGSGKTALLEAIHVVGRGRSPRTHNDQELISFGSPGLSIAGRTSSQGIDARVIVTARRGPPAGKSVVLNAKPVTRLSQLLSVMPVVSFAPEDLELVRGGPEPRRGFLDAVLSHLSPDYLADLLEYTRVLRQRNAVLKSMAERPGAGDELSVWTAQLVDIGARVVRRRLEMLHRVGEAVARHHRGLSRGEEALALEYRGTYGPAVLSAGTSEAEIRERFDAELAALRSAEASRALTLAGPHRDDLLLRLDGRPARSFASQGQARTASLALRQAEVSLVAEAAGRWPVILLDDVLPELDPRRQDELPRLLPPGAQVFVTGTDEVRLRAAFPDAAFFRVAGGRVARA